MDTEEFKNGIKQVSQFLVEYNKGIANKTTSINVSPGFLHQQEQTSCPTEGEHILEIFREFEKKILPGVTPWASPHFHSQLPAGNSYESMIAEMMIAGINNVSLNWEACPAATELEMLVLNWIVKMMELPNDFLLAPGNSGGGVLQNTTTESTFLCLLGARHRSIENFRKSDQPDTNSITDSEIINKLVFYSSTLAHSATERISLISSIKLRQISTNSEGKVLANSLRTVFKEDIAQGLIPCMFISTMGTNALCSFDNLEEIGPVCKEFNLWLHVDAAYAGSALVCPEFRYMSKGIEFVDSFVVGLHKWFLMSLDVVGLWIKDGQLLTAALNVDPLYLRHKHVGSTHDYMNWQLGTGRKFKALKVWIVMKSFGGDRIRENIRRHVKMAMLMQEKIGEDDRFEIVACHLGIVCFRLKNGNTASLLHTINKKANISLASGEFDDKLFIKFIVNQNTQDIDIDFAWKEVQLALK